MRGRLRLRLFASVLAAALIPSAPLTIVVLLQVRDALYARRIADARQNLRQCTSNPVMCESLGAQRLIPGCGAPVQRAGSSVLLCEEGMEIKVDLAPVKAQLDVLVSRLLVALGLFVLLIVALALILLDRGVVRRLGAVDLALEAVGAEQGGPELLPEGGDAVGRVGAAVNRLAGRLREERGRTRAQIDALETANRDLRTAREDLARSERLASVGRLAAGVAHEVGNPVSALIGYAALMRDRLAQKKDVSEYVDRVEREATRIDRIVRDLLDLARPSALKAERVELPRAVELARALVEPQPAWKGVALRAELPADLPAVSGEEHYLVQVIVNLLANAARAGAREVRLRAASSASAVELTVADDGAGIPPEALPRLFEPFFTTAAPGQGTGLGLALCHATMDRIGGSISARNGVKGALFELRFKRWTAAT